MQRNFGQSELLIDLEALVYNWQYYKNLCKNSEIAAVVKANSYGLGIEKCAQKLEKAGCKLFFVAHISEGIELRNYINKSSQIFVLNGIFENEKVVFKQYNLIPIINDFSQIEYWDDDLYIHIDTGMNRLGIRFDECDNLIKYQDRIKFIMSHLACSSDISNEYNGVQLERFKKAASLFPNAKKSFSASAGALISSDYRFDIIRQGIALYGGNPLDTEFNELKPVAILNSPILQIRLLKENETQGYGASFKTDKDIKIAIVALGYADGFLRSASNSGYASINGIECPIIGRISMDLIAINIDNIENVKTGDNVEFLGANTKLDKQAEAMQTINYEILTRLGNRFNKKYIND